MQSKLDNHDKQLYIINTSGTSDGVDHSEFSDYFADFSDKDVSIARKASKKRSPLTGGAGPRDVPDGHFAIGEQVMIYDNVSSTWLEGQVLNRMEDMYNVQIGAETKICMRQELMDRRKVAPNQKISTLTPQSQITVIISSMSVFSSQPILLVLYHIF